MTTEELNLLMVEIATKNHGTPEELRANARQEAAAIIADLPPPVLATFGDKVQIIRGYLASETKNEAEACVLIAQGVVLAQETVNAYPDLPAKLTNLVAKLQAIDATYPPAP